MVFRLIFISLLFTPSLHGQELPAHFHPVRPYAMGGAFTAVANDENAVWTNPAGIARIRKARSRQNIHLIKVPNMIVGASAKSRSFIKGVNNQDNIEQLASQADSLGDKPLWSVLGLFPMIMLDINGMPSATGVYSHTTLKSVVDQENPELAYTEAVSDIGGVFSLAFTNQTNRFNAGVNLRYLARFAYEDNIPITTFGDPRLLQAHIKDGSNRTTALAVDAGMMFTFADFWFPTLGLSILNVPLGCREDYLNPFSKERETVCGTRFNGSIANPDALSTIDPTDIRFGFSISPRLSRNLGVRIALDVHHIHFSSGDKTFGYKDVPIQKKIHTGAEFFIGNPLSPAPLSFATGLSQGYYTMGLSLRQHHVSFDLTTMGRDISTDDKPVEDRRIMASLSLDF